MCKNIETLSSGRYFILFHCPDCEKVNIRHYSYLLAFNYSEFAEFCKMCCQMYFHEHAVYCSGQEQIFIPALASGLKLCLIQKEFNDLKQTLKEASANLKIPQSLMTALPVAKRGICLN